MILAPTLAGLLALALLLVGLRLYRLAASLEEPAGCIGGLLVMLVGLIGVAVVCDRLLGVA